MSMSTSMTHPQSSSARQGLTLLELVVVLTILVALGGILVPVLGNFLTRSHAATCTTNIGEISKSVMTFQAERNGLPNNWQTGIAGAAIPVDQMWNGQPAIAAGAVVNEAVHGTTGIETLTLTAGEAAALVAAGITNVIDHGAAAADVSFDIDGQNNALAATDVLITLTNDQARSINLPYDTAGVGTDVAPQRYVWLAFGPENTLFGQGALEAPMHFSDEPELRADRAYSRFGAVFQLANDNGTVLSAAKFKRVSYNLGGEVDGWENIDSHVKVYYEDTRN